MKPTSLLQDVQLRLAHLACPACQEGRLDLRIRCDLDSAECLYIATCDACATQYMIDRDSAEELDDSFDGDVTFSCDAVTHRCAYRVPDHGLATHR